MSASTPAIQGGIGTRRLGAALAAIALAIVALVAIVGFQAAASRTSTAPAAVPAPAPASLYDRGWATDSGKLSSPMFAVPGDHASATDGSSVAAPATLPRVFDPSQLPKGTLVLPRAFDPNDPTETQVGGGRGTRMAR